MRTQELGDLCDRNYLAAFAALVPHVAGSAGGRRSFGPVDAVVTLLPRAFYNPVFVTNDRTLPEEVKAAVEWVSSLGVPASVQLRDGLQQRFGRVLRQLRLEPDPWVTPGMALYPIPERPRPPVGLHLELVCPDTFEDWHAGIGYPSSFRGVYGPTLLDDTAFRLIVGYADEEPVTGAAAIIHDEVVGIYAVGTVEHARRRGFGQAATWAAIQAGADAGCTVSVLQATDEAVSVYQRMGFSEVSRYLEWMPPD